MKKYLLHKREIYLDSWRKITEKESKYKITQKKNTRL